MTKEYFIDKVLPIIVIVITTITLAMVLFVVLFNYIENKKISNLEKTGAVDNRGGRTILSEEAIRRSTPPPDAVPTVLPEEAIRRSTPLGY